MPEFWLGMLLLIAFGVGVGPFPGIFPIGGLITPGVDTAGRPGGLDVAWHLVLPVITLTLVYLAEYSLVMRSSLLDELGEDYLTTARAKGLRGRRRCAAGTRCRTRCCPPIDADLPQPRLRRLRRDHGRDGVLLARPGPAHLRGAERRRTSRCCRALFLLFSAAVIVANLIADLLLRAASTRGCGRMTAEPTAGRAPTPARSARAIAQARPALRRLVSGASSGAERGGMVGLVILVVFVADGPARARCWSAPTRST